LRQLVIFLCLLLFTGQASAQTLKGLVTDSLNSKPLSPVVITNLRTNQSVYSDDDGQFTLHAQTGDKLALVYIGYRTRQWVMPPAIGAVRHRIEMQPLSYQLDELVVRTRNYTKYQIDSLERRDIYQRALSRERSGSVMSPVTLLAEKLSKKSRQTFKFQKEFNYWEHQRFIDSRYTPDLVNILTGLEGDTLAHFMNAYPIPYDYVRAATDLELKMWIRTNYREFLRKQLAADSLKTSR
jgi:hypothetical protein